ncbi:hypothetical protein V2W45_1241670, partial [Cenococcum geophilum]
EISLVRKEELNKLTKDFCRNFLTILRRVAREDNCVEVLYKTLFYIFLGDKFIYLRKVGIVLYFSVFLLIKLLYL